MIRKIEYTQDDIRYSYAYEDNLPISGDTNVKVSYPDNPAFLSDPDNGYMDDDGNATQKLKNLIGRIDTANESTWDTVISNVSYLDKRPIRNTGSRLIGTYHDQSGDINDLVTGIGDIEDCSVLHINYDADPDVMSKDLFISTLSGFVIGDDLGTTNELDYSSIYNPINQNNVNNFYPVIKHGYFYSGQTEYYLYSNKHTEIIPEEQYSGEVNGYKYYDLSGTPNEISPIILNVQYGNMQDIMEAININDYSTYSRNSYRIRYSGTSLSVHHNLKSYSPFAYIVVDNTNEIVLPVVEIVDLNRANISTTDSITGYLNIIRPNRYFRNYTISSPDGVTIRHNLESTNIFTVINDNDSLALPYYTVDNESQITVTAVGASGTLQIVNMSNYTYSEDLDGFASGYITHNLGMLTDTNHDAYLDPMVYLIENDGAGTLAETYITDQNTVYLDFNGHYFSGTVHIIDYSKFNQAGSLINGTPNLSTEYFGFQDTTYFGNIGPASPFHITDPLTSTEYDLECRPVLEEIQEQNIPLSGYLPDYPLYLTRTNQIVIPPHISGNLIVTYEHDGCQDTECDFRDVDISPVTWYNTPRVIAIQIEQDSPYSITIIPDDSDINMQNVATRTIHDMSSGYVIESPIGGTAVSGEPATSMNITAQILDEAGVSLSGYLITFDTSRKLYSGYDGDEIFTYDVNIIDNTSELLSLPSGLLDQISGITLQTPSIFDEIVFHNDISEETDIYDAYGYLFTTIPGVQNYRIKTLAALYDSVSDTLSHKVYRHSDNFGSAISTLCIHNDPYLETIKPVTVSAYLSKDPTISGSSVINIHPVDLAETYGLVNNYESSNMNITTIDVTTYPDNGYMLSTISGEIIPCASTISLIDTREYNLQSGILDRDAPYGIIDVFNVNNMYMIHHLYESGRTVLRYDIVDNDPAILDIGEYYGNN